MKASMSSTKYVIYGNFKINGYIDKSDLIGSFFGQTEGLIGEELEFSNLQKMGKLGRIDIFLKKNHTTTKTTGKFTIPTALDKTQVSLVAAAIESIERIGHCTGSIKITTIKDERDEKRKSIIKRAETLLKNLKEDLPISEEITININNQIKKKSIKEHHNNIFANKGIEKKEEIILVEGKADIENLTKHGFDNIISFDGSKMPKNPINKLIKNKTTTVFLDDDSAGHKELELIKDRFEINYYCFAPEGKEVEELNIKEINKAIKNKKENIIKEKNTIIDKIKKALTIEKKTEDKEETKIETIKEKIHKPNQKQQIHNNNKTKPTTKQNQQQNNKTKLTNNNNKTKPTTKQKNLKKETKNNNKPKQQQNKINKQTKSEIRNLKSKNTKQNLKEKSKNQIKQEQTTTKPNKKTNKNTNTKFKKSILNQKEINEIKKIMAKMKNKNLFIILDNNLKNIKEEKIEEYQKITKISSAKILIINAICESSILKKSTELKIKNIIAKKKTNFKKINSINIQLFDEFKNN